MAYGYNPADFATDFSWIGDIGKSFGQFASSMPELLSTNREIKENNNFKQKSYAASNQFIDKLDKNIISNVASSMGIDASDDKVARQKLKEMIPQFSDKMTNEEYAKQVVDSFYTPFMSSAFSNKGGGSLTFGDVVANTNYGVLQDAIRSSSIGKEQQEQKDYDKSFGRKQTELKSEVGIRNEGELDQNKKLKEQNQQIQKDYYGPMGPVVQDAIKSGKSSDLVLAEVFEKTGDHEIAKLASDAVKETERQDLQEELRKMQDDARKAIEAAKDKEKLTKVYDLDKIDKSINTVESNIAKYEGLMGNSKNMSASEKATYKGTIALLKKQLSVYEKVKVNLIEQGGSVTTDDANKAYLKASQEVDPEAENRLIELYMDNTSTKQGGFSGGMPGRNDDKKRFEQAYRERFNKDPKYDEQGNPIPILGQQQVNQTQTTTSTQDTTDLTKQKDIQLIKQLEAAKSTETDVNKIKEIDNRILGLKLKWKL